MQIQWLIIQFRIALETLEKGQPAPWLEEISAATQKVALSYVVQIFLSGSPGSQETSVESAAFVHPFVETSSCLVHIAWKACLVQLKVMWEACSGLTTSGKIF